MAGGAGEKVGFSETRTLFRFEGVEVSDPSWVLAFAAVGVGADATSELIGREQVGEGMTRGRETRPSVLFKSFLPNAELGIELPVINSLFFSLCGTGSTSSSKSSWPVSYDEVEAESLPSSS